MTVAYAPVDYRRWREWDTSDKVVSYDYPDGSRMYVQIGYDNAGRTYLRQQFWEQRFTRWSKAVAILLASVLVPPALLFLLGYVILWIARGFAGDASTQNPPHSAGAQRT